MNCLAHAYQYLHDPYLAAGTCIPDWLGMVDRKTRVRKANAQLLADSVENDPITRSIAGGIVQHLHDDDWFHATPAFAELNALFSTEIANSANGNPAMRSGFLGHVLIELLLDSAIAEQYPRALDDYYRAMAEIDAAKLQQTVNQLAKKPTEMLAAFMPRYLTERFLYDYLEDAPLLRRLNGIMRRIQIPELPDAMLAIIKAARPLVRARRDDLLTPIYSA